MKYSPRILVVLGGAIIASLLLTAASYAALRQFEAAAETRQAMRAIVNDAVVFLSELKDAETGQRGFLITGNEAFLQPYSAVRGTIPEHLQALRLLAANSADVGRLDTVAPLVDAKLMEMSELIKMRRNNDQPGVLAAISGGRGKQLMDSIRVEMAAFGQTQERALQQHEAVFQSAMVRLFVLIGLVSLIMVVLALAFAWLMHRDRQHRLDGLAHRETERLLAIQKETSALLHEANATLQVSQEKLAVTLFSIGDAVMTTDADARVTLLNPLAEALTGWTQAAAMGHPVDEVFRIINKETRKPSLIPVIDALAHGTIQGLANHTVLIAVDGGERDIADSCAPIRDHDGQVVGAVLVFRDVTEEYAVQQALRDGAAVVQAIFNTVADGLITIDEQGKIEAVNRAAERLFGYSSEELVGQNLRMLMPPAYGDAHDKYLQHFMTTGERRISDPGREFAGQHRNGTSFPIDLMVNEMWLADTRHFVGVIRDISAHKLQEETLLQAGALQSAIFNSANFSSIATDAHGVIQIFNVGAEHMLGYAAADVMNKITPAAISDPQELVARAEALSVELGTPITPGFDALVFKASRGIEDIYELTYIRKDGSRFPAVVSVTALRDAQSAIIGYLLIGTDNTARKQIEAERLSLDERLRDSLLALQEKHVELGRSKAAADKANLAKSDFLSSMSHELRSPLNAILGFAQFMESDTPPPTESAKASIDQILHAGWYLLKLINEILDLAVIESGKISLSTEPVDLAPVLNECQTMIEPQAQRRGIKMVFPQAAASMFVTVDRTRLKQVIINLLSNAIKYNQLDGRVEVTCEMTGNGAIRISVADTGVGLSEEKVGQLFEAFNRLGQEHGPEEGTGIDLMVSKQLVELMGGTIGARSVVGSGSVFWIEFQASADQGLAGREIAPTMITPLPQVGGLQMHTLLYIEDNPANLTLVERLIARRPDLRLLTATEAIRGIELARTQMPDVILMDINLPGMSGVQALGVLLKDPLTQHIPVIALSANARANDVQKGLEAGFFRYLTKPIHVAGFMSTLTEALEFAELGRPLPPQPIHDAPKTAAREDS